MPQERSNAKVITSSILIVLLLSSFAVLLGGSNNAEAQEVSTSELSAASGSNRFVVWQDTTGTGPGDIYFKRSTDNGATWKASVNLSKNAGLSHSPKIVVSGAFVFVVWAQSNADNTKHDIFLKRSTDNGATWKANQKITPGGTCSSGSACHALGLLAVSGSSVYLVTEKSGDVFLRRSADNGATWKSPVNLSSNAGNSYDPDIAVSGANVYVSWTQANTGNTSFDILFRRSIDSGATWKSKVNLSNDPTYSFESEVAAAGSNVYVTWAGDVTETERALFLEVKLKRSLDAGSTWDSTQVMSTPRPDVSGAEEYGAWSPQIIVTGSNVYLAWKDVSVPGDKDAEGDIVIRTSLNNGNSWNPQVKVGDADNNNNPWNCMPFRLAAVGSNVYLAWAYSAACGDNERIAFSASTDSGATWSTPDDMTNTFLKEAVQETPIELVATDSSVFMVIIRKMGGPGSDIFVARSTDGGQNWGLGLNLSKLSGDSVAPQIGL